MKKSLTDEKMSNAKLSTQLDYSLESNKVIEKNMQAYKQEISMLRTKAERYSKLVEKVIEVCHVIILNMHIFHFGFSGNLGRLGPLAIGTRPPNLHYSVHIHNSQFYYQHSMYFS